jgi:hypothetical protein
MLVVFKKPYGFLIKKFKLIHLFLTALYIYLTIKTNSIYQYYKNFIGGSASKLDAMGYVTHYYVIAVLLSIGICLIIYALMRYKKKPRMLYLLLIGLSILTAFMISYSYQGLDTIYISVLDTKSLLLYRDLFRILLFIQYIAIVVVLIRGLGFDIKKFNFVQDLEELDIDVSDEEEVELTLGGNETLVRKFHRQLREIRYYYFENKLFILVIIIGIIVLGGGYLFVHHEVIDKEYQENEVFSSDQFQFKVLSSYVTNRGYDNAEIMKNGTSFVVVRMIVASNGEKKEINTSNLVLKVNKNHYVSSKKYASYFDDLGDSYLGQKIGSAATYLFIYNIDDEDVDGDMRIVYAEDKVVHLNTIFLDKVSLNKEMSLNESIDLSQSSLGSGSFKIRSVSIGEKFSYAYQYEVNGKLYDSELSISSVQNVIMHLEIESSYPYQLDHYTFLERYATLKYKVGDQEYVSSFSDKTPGNYQDGLYLSVDKKLQGAESIWLEIRIRNLKYTYTLK